MLMKLTLGVDFINILQAAFTCAFPKAQKRLMACIFCTFGICAVKAKKR